VQRTINCAIVPGSAGGREEVRVTGNFICFDHFISVAFQ